MRIKITKSKNSESLYIIRSYRVGSKSTTKIVKKLGSLKDLINGTISIPKSVHIRIPNSYKTYRYTFCYNCSHHTKENCNYDSSNFRKYIAY